MSNGNDTEFNLAQAMLDELREHGWIKGALSNKDGKCMKWAASEVSSSRREKAKIRYKMKYLPMRPYEEIILGWVRPLSGAMTFRVFLLERLFVKSKLSCGLLLSSIQSDVPQSQWGFIGICRIWRIFLPLTIIRLRLLKMWSGC